MVLSYSAGLDLLDGIYEDGDSVFPQDRIDILEYVSPGSLEKPASVTAHHLIMLTGYLGAKRIP